MKNLVKVETVLTERKRPGQQKKVLDLAKLEKISVAVAESATQETEDLLIFDARCLDASTARELLRIFPQLIHVRRAWKAEFLEYGCKNCHRKRVWYGAGGLCTTCHPAIARRMRIRLRNVGARRDVAEELATITRKFDIAQQLLNGGE